MAVAAPTFTGFRPEAIQFLVDLSENNDRAWFQPRKGEYEQLLKEPLEALISTLAERFAARGIPLRADPSKSPFRIYRDVRTRSHTGNVHSGGGYFHLSPGEIYVGGGIWHPEKPWLDAFRRRVVDEPGRVRKLVEEPGFKATFGSLGGDSLVRVPTGFAPDHPDVELLKLKDVTFGRRLSDAEAMSPGLPDLIADTFEAAMPVMRYLAAIG